MLAEREILYADRFVPALMASFGCHCFNLVNRENEIFHFQGRVPDLRMQVLFTAPPGFCLHPKTSIMLEDGSRLAIEHIKVGDRLMKGASIQGSNIVEHVSMRSIGKQIVRVQPHDLRMSLEHRVLTDSGWKLAGDLRVGDLLRTRFTYNDLRLLGFWIAEGRFEGKGPWTPTISNTSQKLLDGYAKPLSMFGVNMKERGDSCEYACVRPYTGKYSENHFAKFLRYMGYNGATRARNKHIPEELFSIASFGKKMLLRGMWDGDGSKKKDKRYYTSSKVLSSQVQRMLTSLGVDHSHYAYPVKGYDYDMHTIYVHKKHENFMDYTGRFTDQTVLGWSRIESIDMVQSNEVLYDLSTTGESFIANNVVVHNSKTLFMKQLIKPGYGILFNEAIPELSLNPPYSGPAFRFMGSCCLPAGVMIEMADGTRKPIEDVHMGDRVYSLDSHWKLRPNTVTNKFRQVADVQETTLEHGYVLPSTPNHPFRTMCGWVEARHLKVGDEVAVSMRYPKQTHGYDNDVFAMLGLFTANGSFNSMVFYTIDEVVVAEAKKIVQKWGLDVYPTRDRGYDYVIKAKIYNHRNQLKTIFREVLGVNDLSKMTRSKKFIPDEVFKSNNGGVATYLRWLFTDGYADENLICLKQENREMLEDVRELLKRFNVVSSIDSAGNRLAICDLKSKREFMKYIGFVGKHSNQLFPDKKSLGRTSRRISSDFWDLEELDEVTRSRSWNRIKRESGLSVWDYRRARSQPTHETVGVIAEFLESDELMNLSNSDVMFLRVKDKKHLDPTWVYNISVEVPNFVANGIVTHNTEAGWTGSSDGSGSNTAKLIGQAEKFKNGVIGMDEFKAITQIMNQDHSGHLEQMVNMSLFEGDVEKDLKGITISYHTDITLWAGNQVMNFDISGGLFRRFLPMLWIPTLAECEALKHIIWKGDNVKMNEPRLDAYRGEVARWYNRLKRVKSVTFHKSLRDVIGDSVHYEQLVLRNFALGYTLMSDSNVPGDVVVGMSPPLREALRSIIAWRRMLLADPRGFQVVQLLLDLGGASKYVPWNLVRESNLIFSTSFETTDEVLRNLIDQRRVDHDMRGNGLRIR